MLFDELVELKALASKCADARAWALSDAALVDSLDTVHEAAQMVAAAQSHVIREIDSRGIAAAQHASSTAASRFEPSILRKVGQRILTHIAPEIAEAADEAALRRMEARAWQTRALRLTRHSDGRVRLTGWLDEAGAATVNAALDPLCAPRHDSDEPRSPSQRRADALVEVCELATRTVG